MSRPSLATFPNAITSAAPVLRSNGCGWHSSALAATAAQQTASDAQPSKETVEAEEENDGTSHQLEGNHENSLPPVTRSGRPCRSMRQSACSRPHLTTNLLERTWRAIGPETAPPCHRGHTPLPPCICHHTSTGSPPDHTPTGVPLRKPCKQLGSLGNMYYHQHTGMQHHHRQAPMCPIGPKH